MVKTSQIGDETDMEPNALREEPLIPDKFKILSGSALKLIAVLSMLIDHTAMALLKDSNILLFSFLGHKFFLYDIMRDIGRLAFPIFVFLLTEGFLHTKNRTKYGLNLFVFALISEIPWNLLHQGTVIGLGSMNVFFTLLFGYLGIWAMEYFKDRKDRMLFSLLGLLILSVIVDADYGCNGYGFILLLYVLRENKILQAVIGSCFLNSRWIAGFSFIPINLYNGERGFIKGKAAKYAFYAIYPVHMLILYWIKVSLGA